MENRVEQIKSGQKPFYVNLRVGTLYDSRVGATSGGDDENGDRALALSFSSGWQIPIAGAFGFRIDYGGYADFHEDFSEYDVIDQTLSLEPQWTTNQLTFSLPLMFNYVMEDGETNYNRYTILPTVTWLIPQTHQAVAIYAIGSKIEDRDNDKTLDEDGKTFGCGCSFLAFLNDDCRLYLSLDYQQTKYDVQVVNYGTDSMSTAHRKDNNLTAGLDIQYKLNKYVAVYVNYSFTNSKSNVSVFQYDRNIINLGIAFTY